MDDGWPGVSIIWFLLLLFIDMFFYGFGAAVDALNIKEIERRAQEKDRKSIRLKKIIGDPTEYVNTVQLIVTLINVVIGAYYLGFWLNHMTRFLESVAEQNLHLENLPMGVISAVSMVLTLLILLYIVLSFGVLLPKKLGARSPEKWAYACITPVYFITVLLKPFTGLVSVTVKGILYLCGVRDNENESDVTEEEIINMVNEGHEQGLIQASEAEMISNIFEYGDKEARDIMTHRKHVIAIESGTGIREAVDFMICEHNSRYPVYEENIDHVIGILHLKDALRVLSEGAEPDRPVKELQGLLREPYFVPETKNIDELFKEMQSRKLQMVIVVDEYGQTEGLVAMEDILEEIVGNIMDEYDEDREYIEERGDDEYLMEGKTPLEELEERLSIDFADQEFETLNGFLISRLDRIPEPGEQFDVDYQGYHFQVLDVENKMIQRVLVKKLPREDEEEGAQTALEEKGK